jgi:DNA polymerase-1
VETLFKRRRYIPELKERNFNIRAFGERVAANAPIQGSAADLIKIAMIRVHEALANEGLAARMLLQVHDELIFEAPEAEAAAASEVIRRVMAAAPLPAVALSVPLVVDVRAAANWDDAH